MTKIMKIMVPFSIVGAVVGGTVLFRDRMGGERYRGEEQIHGKTVIITGATSGLGKETAQNLAKRGGRILMACRDMEKCREISEAIREETFNKNVECRKLDLSSMKSIRAFADDINKNEKRVDILINNAGVMALPKRELTEDGLEWHLAVNCLGPFLLTHLLLDKLKASKPSRILNLTCVAFKKGKLNFRDLNSAKQYDDIKSYSQSKLGMYVLGKEFAKRLKGTRVSVYNIHPGMCFTDIGRNMGSSKSHISSSILYPIWWYLLKTPDQGIQTTLHCALDPKQAIFSGEYYEECQIITILPERMPDDDDGRRLWAIAEAWTRLAGD